MKKNVKLNLVKSLDLCFLIKKFKKLSRMNLENKEEVNNVLPTEIITMNVLPVSSVAFTNGY